MEKPPRPGSLIRQHPPHERGGRLILLGILSSIVFLMGVIFRETADISSVLVKYKEELCLFYYASVNRLQTLHLPRMRSIWLTALTFCAAVLSQSVTIDQYIDSESSIAKVGVLANIGPSGAKSSGAKAGVVIASPSTSDPDYLYTWTRDSALVYKMLIDQYTLGEDISSSLRGNIDNYVSAQTILQQVSNPSGTVSTGGLGEPKFNIDLTAFTASWGRPQRDGPPLRAISLITYANWLIANSNTTYVTGKVWPVIKLDLDYTAKHWNQSGFDLWEEVSSRSFFTTAVQHRALRQGAALATKIGQNSLVVGYSAQADNILCFLQSYWSSTGNYITSNTGGGRSGKDANSVLASIHSFDAAAGCDSRTFQPCSDKALANHKAYVDAFRSIYTINSGIAANKAVATGRYPEDVYYGGQAWYLTTAAAAEQLYDALIVWKAQGSLQVTSTSLAFFRQFSSSIQTGTYASSTSTFATLTAAIKEYADGFILVNAKYTPSNGALAEQYHRNTGVPLSAKDLTWSYASTLTAFASRKGFIPASWGAKDLVVPSVCVSNQLPMVPVTFTVVASTVWGESIYLTGSIDELKNWSPTDALILSSTSYPTWSITVNVPVSTKFDYKFLRKANGVVSTWESDPNRFFQSPASGNSVLSDTWR
ncbi:glycoside hydrolase family 15 protein [Crucibulum laeve]|uniref:Glucoamylase n=1 Tax=Crucibulum laeve TaxID=68775 RepID=A0A5C3M641_9AGAR|nr:glycoside hydrolase family 15 protein [Crucibulum laeve]